MGCDAKALIWGSIRTLNRGAQAVPRSIAEFKSYNISFCRLKSGNLGLLLDSHETGLRGMMPDCHSRVLRTGNQESR